jgi:hypothetical protein
MFGAAQGWNREVPDDVRNESCCPSSGSSGIPPPRATPLVWLTVNKAELRDRRSLYEHRVLVRLAEILPANVTVCIIADRGFGDQNLYRVLTEDRRAALRLRHTLPRQRQGDGRYRRNPHCRGLGEPERASACAAWHGGLLSGWHRSLRARP